MTYTKYLDLRYTKNTEPDFRLDIWTPDGMTEKTPWVLMVHGANTNKAAANFVTVAEAIVNSGRAWVSINYGDDPASYILPAQYQHIAAAIRWVRHNADTYNIKKPKLTLVASSFGAFLATGYGVTWDQSFTAGFGKHDTASQEVQACIPVSGTLHNPDYADLSTDAYTFAGSLFGCGDLVACGATSTYLPQGYYNSSRPPFLLIAGDADPDIGIEQFRMTQADMLAHGMDADLIENSGAGHGWTPNANPQIAAMLAFMTAHGL